MPLFTPRFRPWIMLGAFFVQIGCEEEKRETPLPPPPVVESPPVAPPTPPPWFSGSFVADAKLTERPDPLAIDRAEQASDNKSDSTAKVEGEGILKLEIQIDEQRSVMGKAHVNEAEANAIGVVDGETIRIRLRGEKLNGTVVAAKKGDSFVGSAHLSVLEGASEKPTFRPLDGPLELYRKDSSR